VLALHRRNWSGEVPFFAKAKFYLPASDKAVLKKVFY
jgi:hypothetical protein